MFRFHKNRFRFVFEIERYDQFVDIICDRCCLTNCFYIAMKHFFHRFECFECIRIDKSCVNMSWFSLNRIRDENFQKIVENEKILTIVITRLFRNKFFLKKINAKTNRKTQCLLSKMKKSNALKFSKYFVANVFIVYRSSFDFF